MKRTNQKGVTLIALIVTIVLNCSYLAMVVRNKKDKIIEKRRKRTKGKECKLL